MERVRNFIGGEWVDPLSGRWTKDTNPARPGEVLAELAVGGPEDVRAAVAAAKAAFQGWRRVPAPRRGEILRRALGLFEEQTSAIARTLTMEQGKTLAEATAEVRRSLAALELAAGEGRRLGTATLPTESATGVAFTRREPLGVVAIITPWPAPFASAMQEVAPALAAGNACVLKPASLTPLTARMLVETFHDAGVPRGVLSLVVGPGDVLGEALVGHPDVAAISFAGSRTVGRALHARAVALGKKAHADLGGPHVQVVLEDADLDLAASAAVTGAFGSAGQRAGATSRVVAVEAVHDALLTRIVSRTLELSAGDPLRAGVSLGPVAGASQSQELLRQVDAARSEGARLACGGGRLRPSGCEDGSFVAPTVLAGVRPHMRIAQDDVFGPVLVVLRVRDLDEALAVAGGVRYGLSSSVYTRDVERVFRFVTRIATSLTYVNSPPIRDEARMGRKAIEFYSELKTVVVDEGGSNRSKA